MEAIKFQKPELKFLSEAVPRPGFPHFPIPWVTGNEIFLLLILLSA